MVLPSNEYDPNKYGNTSERIPEGVHQFEVTDAEVVYWRDSNERWQLVLQPCEAMYRNKYGFKVWLNVDGCVNALFDAMGLDPKAVKMMEYTPDMFIGKKLMAEIYNKPDKTDPDKTWANVRKLYPAFSKKGSAPRQEEKKSPAKPAQNPFPEDDEISW